MSRILVTGAGGFVGRALSRELLARGNDVVGFVRRAGVCVDGVREWVDGSPDFAGLDRAWTADAPVDCVIHLAARVHVLDERDADPDIAFERTNVSGTLRVAQAAVRHGVRRLVFVSSIKAVGERDHGLSLREDDVAEPQDPYGRSKRAAEAALMQFGLEHGLEIVIVRPPLVYGPEVRANFLSMMDAIWRGIPLPLRSVTAQRSVVFVDNLADALVLCITHPRAAGQCFHIADDTLSVSELLMRLGVLLHRPARLVPVPVDWLRMAARITGRTAQIDRLVTDLRVDASRIRDVLGWQAPFSTDEGLSLTADWYRSTH
ncbi:NAD-dependent dehydratase [Burkholderia stagnalis]|uniref:NAD-dependent epimerase/dehydratase family protein n=1 Tax=Burkholderia stagnalis TaxID=1503054 RepID=UPI0007522F83|nr:NAD-dependent epimerase/dehydratase family protein [Burkholderia stagnalis]KVN31139.1 NAD-dependent dehydratase [Burkholderia stagnalis]